MDGGEEPGDKSKPDASKKTRRDRPAQAHEVVTLHIQTRAEFFEAQARQTEMPEATRATSNRPPPAKFFPRTNVYLDTCASEHMSPEGEAFTDLNSNSNNPAFQCDGRWRSHYLRNWRHVA